jgi:hypothetical protein
MKSISKLKVFFIIPFIFTAACKNKNGDDTPPLIEKDSTAHYEFSITLTYPSFDNPNKEDQTVYTFEFKNGGFSEKTRKIKGINGSAIRRKKLF